MNTDVFHSQEMSDFIQGCAENIAFRKEMSNEEKNREFMETLQKAFSTIDPYDLLDSSQRYGEAAGRLSTSKRLTSLEYKTVEQDVIMGRPEDDSYRDTHNGTKNPFVGADEDTFTTVKICSRIDRIMAGTEEVRKVTEEDLQSGLKDVEYIRSLCQSPISVAVGGVSEINESDLVRTDKEGVFLVPSHKLRSVTPSSCISFGKINTPASVHKLNDSLRMSLSSSAEFKSFVAIGAIAISSLEEFHAITTRWEQELEERKKRQEEQDKKDGTIIEVDKVLKYALEHLDTLRLMFMFEELLQQLESLKGSTATDSEKLRIASEILTTAQNGVLETYNTEPDLIVKDSETETERLRT